MNYKKHFLVECNPECMFRNGEECTLTHAKFLEHVDNETTDHIRCAGEPGTYLFGRIEEFLIDEEIEADAENDVGNDENEDPATKNEGSATEISETGILTGEIIPPFKNYEEFKNALDLEIMKEVEGYVRIGYLLKVARDTNILAESGYRNLEEFADAEYHIDKSRVSRYIAINDRFAVGGYGMELVDEFKGFGVAKLSLMLMLSDEINAELTPNLSKSDIQTIRDEVADAQKTTPIETMLEGQDSYNAPSDSLLQKIVLQIGENYPDLYRKIYLAGRDVTAVKFILAPSGERLYSVRIRGLGKYMMPLKDYEPTFSIINERTSEREVHTWEELTDAWMSIINFDVDSKVLWCATYGHEFPEDGDVTPVQPEKKVVKVESKQRKSAETLNQTEEADKQDKPAKEQETADSNYDLDNAEQQIPGQMQVTDYPEILPGEDAPEAPKNKKEPVKPALLDFDQKFEEIWKKYTSHDHLAIRLIDEHEWNSAREEVNKLLDCIDQFETLYEVCDEEE